MVGNLGFAESKDILKVEQREGVSVFGFRVNSQGSTPGPGLTANPLFCVFELTRNLDTAHSIILSHPTTNNPLMHCHNCHTEPELEKVAEEQQVLLEGAARINWTFIGFSVSSISFDFPFSSLTKLHHAV